MGCSERSPGSSGPQAAEKPNAPRPGLLFVLSGPSGVGKDAVINRLKEKEIPLHFAVTCTTRAPRSGETDGVSYHFASPERFAEMQRAGALLEWATVHGNLYGTPVAQVREALAGGRDVLLKIDVQGAAQLKRRVPEAVFIFLAPASMAELVARLTNRGTESSQELQTRIHNAYQEMARLPGYDYVVVNCADRLDEAVERIVCIVAAERCRVQPRRISL